MLKLLKREELKKGKYYQFSIFLNTPYARCGGYEDAKQEDITKNADALTKVFKFMKKEFGWNLQSETNSGRCEVWFESLWTLPEIYCHPCEISGTATIDVIEAIENFIEKENFPVTKLEETRIFSEVKDYSAREVYQIAKYIETHINKVKRTSWEIPSNYDFEEFPELKLKFKKYCFAKTYKNQKIEEQKNFLVDLVKSFLDKKEYEKTLKELREKIPDIKFAYLEELGLKDSITLISELEEYYSKINPNLWSFTVEDILNGAVEVDEDTNYCLVRDRTKKMRVFEMED